MRIAIISLPFRANVGQHLQAYATQCVVQNMGHEVTQIDHVKYLRINPWRFPLAIIKRTLKRLAGKSRGPIFYEKSFNSALRELTSKRFAATQNFFSDRRVIDSFDEIAASDYDGYIVGSDQVWRPGYFAWQFQTDFANAFLQFTQGWIVKRVAYAASLGFDDWRIDEDTTRRCHELVQAFDAVSVREESAVALCEQHLGVKPIHVLDPTMLLSAEQYSELADDLPRLEKPALMHYVLDASPAKEKLAMQLSQDLGLTPYRVVSRVDDETAPLEERLMPPIREWLRGYRDADFVITDSFHGTVFAIIFNKPFITIGNVNRGMTRFHSLLSLFGLENRLVDDHCDIDIATLGDIDWEKVNERWRNLKKLSLDFLTSALA